MADQELQKEKYPLSIEHMVVRDGRVEALVCVHDKRCRFTNEALISYCVKRCPSLPEHACKNPRGKTFAAVMNHTSLAHLLEHLVIDFQMRSLNEQSCKDDVYLMGTTELFPDDSLRARVVVSYYDDLVCLAAFKEACAFLNEYLIKGEARFVV